MGDRAVLTLRYGKSDIGVYVHWHGSTLPNALAKALGRRERWDDDSYLARIIVSEIAKAVGIDDSTGMGINPGNPFGEGGPVVDLENGLVILEGFWGGDASSLWSDAIPDGTYTFEQYIAVIEAAGTIVY